MNIVKFRNNIQAALWKMEIVGQLSDGMWENTRPDNHWKCWSYAKVKVGKNVGRNFYAGKDNYNLTAKLLLECIGDRMLMIARFFKVMDLDVNEIQSHSLPESLESYDRYVKLANDGNDYFIKFIEYLNGLGITREVVEMIWNDKSYTMKDLKNDLKDMKKIMKIYNW